MVPIPRFSSWEAFHEQLEQKRLDRRGRRLRGHAETIGERFERGRQALLPLPAAPYEACDKRPTRVSSLSLARYQTNDYSVPTRYGHRQVLVKAYVDDVVVRCGAERIARHRRSYEREEPIFDPVHYLALLERKTNALDQAAPLEGWELPEELVRLRRLLEARLGKAGKREYVQVLRLLEDFPLEEVRAAAGQALELGTISFDAVKHLLLRRLEQRPPRLDLSEYPQLPAAQVEQTSAAGYLALLGQGAGRWRERKFCSRSISRRCGCRPSCASTASWRENAPPRARIILAICCGSASWNCSIAIDERPSGASRPPSSRSSRRSTRSTSRRCRSSTRNWCWSWRAASLSTAAALVHELLEARDERRLLRFQKQLAKQDLPIVDELGYVPLSKTAAELLCEVFSQRYEQSSTMATSNPPCNERTGILGSERMAGALLDRLTHHVHILEMNGDSFRLKQSKRARQKAGSTAP
jgi:hypothetical protein